MLTSQMLETDFYNKEIGTIRKYLQDRQRYVAKQKDLIDNIYESQSLYVNMLNAQKLLSTISDDNTDKTLDFITSMVNKVLSEMFSADVPRITLHRKLYAGTKPHITVELIDGRGNVLDMKLQSGVGVSQVVSFMYAICLIEIRKGRRFLILDERLNGLHKEAKRILSEIIKIFSRSGFQFIFVEYSLNDIGKIYNVEKNGDESRVVALGEGKEYDDQMVYVADDVDLSILDKSYVEEVIDEQ